MNTYIAASPLGALRSQVADALYAAPVEVHSSALDAVAGPCLIIGAGGPWLEPSNSCVWLVRPTVLCVVGRVDPAAAVEMLEDLVWFALGALRALPNMAVERVEDQALTTFGNLDYLTARIVLRTALTMKGPAHGI